jgi:hypothetical protein
MVLLFPGQNRNVGPFIPYGIGAAYDLGPFPHPIYVEHFDPIPCLASSYGPKNLFSSLNAYFVGKVVVHKFLREMRP